MVEVISALSHVISNLIDLTDDLTEFRSSIQVLFGVHENPSFHFLSNFYRSQAFFCFNGFRNEASSLDLNVHEFHDVDSFERAPTLIEFNEVFSDFVDYVLKVDINGLLVDFSINISQRML